MICWDWCTKKHEHTFEDYSGGRMTKRLHLTTEEAKRFYEQTGRHVRDENDVARVHREMGTRDLAKGEGDDVKRRDLDAWMRSGGGGKAPGEFEKWKLPRKSVDIHKLYAKMKEKHEQRE